MLNEALINDVLDEAMSYGADFAELYVEQTQTQSMDLVGGKVDKANRGQDFGIGIRLFQGTNSVYGYTNDASRDNLLKTTREIASALIGPVLKKPLNLVRQNIMNQHLVQTDLNDVPASRRVEKLRQISQVIKDYHPSISQSAAGLSERKQHVLIANTEGTLVEDTL